MRIRSIKPEFWTDAISGEWDAPLALLYIGVWQAADDAGRLRLDPRLLRAELDPFDTKFGGICGVHELLEQLVDLGRILPYEAGDHRYGLVAHFAQHQVINKPTKSRLPAPPDGLRESSGSPPGSVLPKDGVEGKGSGKGKDQGEACAESVADAPAPAPASPVVFTLKCAGKEKTYGVTKAQVDAWTTAYPGIDVLAEIRRSVAWQDAHPNRRKTARGMAGHLVAWFGRAQDSARGRKTGAALGVGEFSSYSGPVDFATGLPLREETP